MYTLFSKDLVKMEFQDWLYFPFIPWTIHWVIHFFGTENNFKLYLPYCLLRLLRSLWGMFHGFLFVLPDHLHNLDLAAYWTWLSFFNGPDTTGSDWLVAHPGTTMRGHTTTPLCLPVGESPLQTPNWQESTGLLFPTSGPLRMSMKSSLEPTWITEYEQRSTHFWILCHEIYLNNFTGTFIHWEKSLSVLFRSSWYIRFFIFITLYVTWEPKTCGIIFDASGSVCCEMTAPYIHIAAYDW